MKLIVCLDDRCGVLFNRRRVSSDSEVAKHILAVTAGAELRCSSYSSVLFPKENVRIYEDPLACAPNDAYCFLEGQDPTNVIDDVRELIVYRWNRVYPSDYRFPMELFNAKMRKALQAEFPGNTHDKITWEVYVR